MADKLPWAEAVATDRLSAWAPKATTGELLDFHAWLASTFIHLQGLLSLREDEVVQALVKEAKLNGRIAAPPTVQEDPEPPPALPTWYSPRTGKAVARETADGVELLFGTHTGALLRDVPIKYLLWLLGGGSQHVTPDLKARVAEVTDWRLAHEYPEGYYRQNSVLHGYKTEEGHIVLTVGNAKPQRLDTLPQARLLRVAYQENIHPQLRTEALRLLLQQVPALATVARRDYVLARVLEDIEGQDAEA